MGADSAGQGKPFKVKILEISDGHCCRLGVLSGSDCVCLPQVSTSNKRRGKVACASELNDFFNCVAVRVCRVQKLCYRIQTASSHIGPLLQRTTDLEFDTACARDIKALTDCATAAVSLLLASACSGSLCCCACACALQACVLGKLGICVRALRVWCRQAPASSAARSTTTSAGWPRACGGSTGGAARPLEPSSTVLLLGGGARDDSRACVGACLRSRLAAVCRLLLGCAEGQHLSMLVSLKHLAAASAQSVCLAQHGL